MSVSSSISPTISSIRSSNVTSPSTPPCSSITIAMCVFRPFISFSKALTIFSWDANTGFLATCSNVIILFSFSICVSMSLTCTNPTISSWDSPKIGILECGFSLIKGRASTSSIFAGSVNIFVLGVITDLITVSSNSNALWTKSLSSFSNALSANPCSTMPLISSSVINGPWWLLPVNFTIDTVIISNILTTGQNA